MLYNGIYIYIICIKTYNGVLHVANIDTVVDKIQQKSAHIPLFVDVCGF